MIFEIPATREQILPVDNQQLVVQPLVEPLRSQRAERMKLAKLDSMGVEFLSQIGRQMIAPAIDEQSHDDTAISGLAQGVNHRRDTRPLSIA